MRYFVWIIFTALCVVSMTSGCKNPKSGALSPEVRTELDSLAEANISAHDKYFKLAERIADLLNEAAGSPTEEAAMAKIQEFTTENSLALSRLGSEMDVWQKHLNSEDRMAMVMQMQAQDFTSRLNRISPSFRKRISYNDQWLRQYDKLMSYLEWHK